jgi:uncharacterized protein
VLPGVKHLRRAALTGTLSLLLVASAHAQFALTGTSYTQNFNGIGSGLPSNWAVNTGATTTSLGSAATFVTGATSWGSATGQFSNMASATGLVSSTSTTDQSNASNRAIGLRQTGSFGDPGAAFVFNFNSSGVTVSAINFDLMMLSVQTRSTSFTIDYGLGSSPNSFTSLGTWTDPGAFGTTSITLSSGLAGLSNQSNVQFRIVTIGGSTGSGTRDSIGLDNFAMSYSASAIPEPSTYAAIIGACALGVAAWQRRRKSQPAA